MKKGKTGKILGCIFLLVVIVFCTIAAIYHKAAYAVFKNLTVRKVDLDDSAEWEDGKSYTDIKYAGDSSSQYLDLYVPGAQSGQRPPLFVLIHGGGFIAGDARTRQAQFMYRFFRDQGYACASINYRLAQEAAFPAGLSDCKAAIRYLRAHADLYGFDAEKVAVWGESAGGYLAVMCAVTDDTEFMDIQYTDQENYGDISAGVNVLVDYYGAIDLGGMAGDWEALGIPDIVYRVANSWISGDVLSGYENVESFWMRKNTSEMTEKEMSCIDPHHYIKKNELTGLSAYIVHGDCDITVPYLHSERLYEALRGKLGDDSTVFHLVPGMGHAADSLYSDEMLADLKHYLDEKLGS